VLLVLLCVGFLLPASASIPDRRPAMGNVPISLDVQTSNPGNSNHLLDPHPFSTEFYLNQFAADSADSTRQQRSSWYSPVTNAASELSKKVASLRRALVRMVP